MPNRYFNTFIWYPQALVIGQQWIWYDKYLSSFSWFDFASLYSEYNNPLCSLPLTITMAGFFFWGGGGAQWTTLRIQAWYENQTCTSDTAWQISMVVHTILLVTRLVCMSFTDHKVVLNNIKKNEKGVSFQLHVSMELIHESLNFISHTHTRHTHQTHPRNLRVGL